MGSRRLAVAACALAIVSAGCAGITTDGKAHVIGKIGLDTGQGDDPSRIIAPPPRPGGGPEEIVRGLLTAEADPAAEHRVARSYLRAPDWDPSVGAMVYAGEPVLTALSSPGASARVDLEVRQTGLVARDGAFVPSAARRRLHFELNRLGGEWRVTDLPDGLVLGQANVVRTYRRTTAYFVQAVGARLVPDQRFLPRDRVPAVDPATSLVQAVIEGPGAWLRPAVRTAIPSGVQLTGPVAVTSGVAEVSLSRGVLSAAASARRSLAAQLVWTLTGGDVDVEAVRLLVESQPLTVAGTSSTTLRRSDFAEADPETSPRVRGPVYTRGGRLYSDDGGRERALAGVRGGLSEAVVSPDGARLAALSGDRLLLGPLAGPLREVARGALLAPSWAPDDGGVWTVLRRGGRVAAALVGRDGSVVEAGALPDHVTQLHASPDGERLALVVGQGAGVHLEVARVENRAGKTVVGGARRIAPSVSRVRSAAWQDAQRVVFVGTQNGATRLWRVDADGWDLVSVSADGLPRAPDEVAGAPGQPLVVSVRGALYRRGALGQWGEPFAEGVDPGYAG
jgi:hypothetical protein